MNSDRRPSASTAKGESAQHRAPGQLDELVLAAKRHREAGRLAESEEALRKILAIQPAWAEVHNNLGTVLKQQGKTDQAAKRFKQAVALKPDYAEAHSNLGNIHREQGQLEMAVARFERALAFRPNFAEAHYNLGSALKDQGHLEKAAACYQQALVHRPDYAEAHNNLGAILNEQGNFQQAAARFERALAFRPNFAEAHYNLGNSLKAQGQLDQAAACYEQALAAWPNFPDAHNNLANTLKAQGQLDQAAARFEQALAINPDFAEAHYNRADLKTFRAGDPDLAELEALAADPARFPAGKRVFVHFALAKALDDVGDHARAFEQLLAGNALKRREVKHDEADDEQTFRLIAEVFDAPLLHRFAAAGDPSRAPIFILGMPRSGSTLVEQILASHPQVHGAGELKNLAQLAHRMPGAGGRPIRYPGYVSALGADGLRRLGQSYLASLPTPPAGKVRMTDKAPCNFFYVGLIRLILPNARIIHTLRDQVDTCVSCFSKLFSAGQAFTYDLAELGRYYRRYSRLMAHWQSVLPPGAMLDVAYENVVDNLEQQARRLIDFCGLPWDDRCLGFHETSRPIQTASNVQVRRPLYRSSVARWHRYEAFLQPLLAELELRRQPE